MANSSNQYWDLDGESLHTYAQSIETLGGDLASAPSFRGSNIEVPGVPGATWVKKVPNSRVLTLRMWIVGTDPDGIPGADVTKTFWKNYNGLLERFYYTGVKQGVLTKRFFDRDGVLRTARAKVSYVGGMQPRMTGPNRASFDVDFELADPFFYADEKQANLVAGANTIPYLGNAQTRKIKLVLGGGRGPTTIFNPGLGLTLNTNATVPSGSTQTLDVENYTSLTQAGSSAPTKSISTVRHSGDALWMLLDRPNNVLQVVTSGTGSLQMLYQEAYL